MNESISQEFKKIFLLEFTKELIKHSGKKDFLKLQEIIVSKEKEHIFPAVTELQMVPQKPAAQVSMIMPGIISAPKPPARRIMPKRLFIPEPRFPQHLEYLKPLPAPGVEIELPKLTPLIKDPAVRTIEANPNEQVIVSGTMGTKPTGIILTKEDIDKVIAKFSELAKIPANEGVYRVVVGNLILAAIVSEVIGSRFIISKILSPPPNINNFVQLSQTKK